MVLAAIAILVAVPLLVLIAVCAWAIRAAVRIERSTRESENRRLMIEQLKAEELVTEIELYLAEVQD